MPIAVYVLALAAFAIGTAEFIISGILPPLAGDLQVSLPTAGLLVTAYAVGVAIGGPLVSIFTARFPPKNVLIVVLATFAASQVLCALAPDYGLLLAARLLSACGHGVFFGTGNVVVAGLVPPDRRGGALALFIGGITVANLLGLPGGTAIGVALGWRATFIAVAALGLLAMAGIAALLPTTPGESHEASSLRRQLRALRHHEVYLSYLTIAIVMTGALAFATYQVAMLIEVTRVDAAIVPLYLLLGGVGSMLGIYAGGRATDWKPMPWLIAILLLQALLAFLMLFALHDKLLMAITIFAYGIAGFAFSTPLQARIIHAAREAPNLASALISTAFNIGIAGGALLGAMLLNAGIGLAQLPAVGIATGLAAAVVAAISQHLDRRSLSPAPVSF
ncbi:MAG TPA: MFS transporter [Alphaproteobacteria bacterium]|nr:MFS transporter [Alphaproteobacteria bacterium]